MKNFKFNKEKICAIILSGFILINTCSCGKSTIQTENDVFAVKNKVDYNETTQVENNQAEENTNKQGNEMIEQKQEEPFLNDAQVVYSEEDGVIIEAFTSIKNKVVDFINSDDVETAKNKAKGVFISIVDFLFYDGEISGIKFNDLTESGKKKVLELVTDIDSCIMNKFPTYKEDISETVKDAYEKASELIKRGANNIKEFSKEKLGEEKYNAIKDAKDYLVEYTKDATEIVGNISSKLWSSAKEKVKKWYEGFRES